jgi:hypothetical protein
MSTQPFAWAALPMPRTMRPIIFFFTLLFALLSPLAQAQKCDFCLTSFSTAPTLTVDNPIVPDCSNPLVVSVPLTNVDLCANDYQIQLFFNYSDQLTQQQAEELFSCIKYTGSTPVQTDVSGFNPAINGTSRILTFKVTIPASSAVTFVFPFQVSATFKTPEAVISSSLTVVGRGLNQSGGFCIAQPDVAAFPLNWEGSYSPVIGQKTVSNLIAEGLLFPASVGCDNQFLVFKSAPGSSAPAELIVDQSYCFTPGNNGRIQFRTASGTVIRVQNGATLDLRQVDIATCPNILANAVIVESGGTLIANQCLFEDFRFAVDARPGSIIKLTNNTFLDNYVGLNLDMTSGGGASGNVTINGLSGNTFRSSVLGLEAPYAGMSEAIETRGLCGISARGYNDLNIFSANIFRALANGILTQNTLLNIKNQSFTDMNSVGGGTGTYTREGFGIHMLSKANHWCNIGAVGEPNTFRVCKTAIAANRMAGSASFNDIATVQVGIDWFNSQNKDIRIRENVISAERIGISSSQNEPPERHLRQYHHDHRFGRGTDSRHRHPLQ